MAAAKDARVPSKRDATPRKPNRGTPKSRPRKQPAKPAIAAVRPAPPPPPPPPAPVAPRRRFRAVLVASFTVLAFGLAAAVLLLRGGDHRFNPKNGEATEASVGDLRSLSTPDRPVYWIGPAKQRRLEVTRTARDAVYVRYLPPGILIGDRSADYTTIGTYAVADPYATLQRAARLKGAVKELTPRGELAVWRKERPTSVYLARKGARYLVEVYAPSARRARALARSGAVRPVP